MEFTDYTCPVCNERFKNGDDVVVCPECGTPHHRVCFENNGHCFYEEKHKEGFSFERAGESDGEDGEESADTVICPNCKAENEKTSFYCRSCGLPLNERDRTQNNSANSANPQGGFNRGAAGPFGFGTAGMPAFDPLAGLDSEEEIAEGVKAGETAKFIGKNTQYYLTVFKNIKRFNKSRFNFSAFFTSGAFFIYRKMTLLGVLISLLVIGLTVGSTYMRLSGDWISQYNSLLDQLNSGVQINLLSTENMWLFAPALMTMLRLIVMFVCGLTANRAYYKHCSDKINEIKEEQTNDVNKVLEERGGVNLPMAISFFAAIAVIYEICNFLLQSTMLGF